MALIKFKNLPDTSTPINATNLNNNFDSVNPVGSILITSTNTNPSSELGGSWELIDKEFIPLGTYKLDSEYITINSTNVASSYFGFTRAGHTITFQMQYTNLVELNDNTIELGTINFEKVGITRFMQSVLFMGSSDGANATILQYIHATSGVISSREVIGGDGVVSSNNPCHLTITITLPSSYMLDSACDKFYWKRTA